MVAKTEHTLEVPHPLMLAVMLPSSGVIPLYSEPFAFGPCNKSSIPDCTEL